MAGYEIGVEMGEKYVLDLERVLGGKRNVLLRIPLRVNDDSGACCLISNNVRRVRQARQVELLKDHDGILLAGFSIFLLLREVYCRPDYFAIVSIAGGPWQDARLIGEQKRSQTGSAGNFSLALNSPVQR